MFAVNVQYQNTNVCARLFFFYFCCSFIMLTYSFLLIFQMKILYNVFISSFMTHNNNEWMYLNEICIFTVGYIFTQNKILPWNVHTFNDNEDKLSFRQNINNFYERMTVAWISKEIGESHFMFFWMSWENFVRNFQWNSVNHCKGSQNVNHLWGMWSLKCRILQL